VIRHISPDNAPLDVNALPARLTRAAAAAVVTQHFFPVSPRTLERWPLATRRVNGKALIEAKDLIALAQSKLENAPALA
jgi:hypothetical protein